MDETSEIQPSVNCESPEPEVTAQKTLTDSEAHRLSGLKTNLQGQIATVLGYIKTDTAALISQVQNRSHNEILRVMNLSMNLVHHLDETATTRVCKSNSENPIARGMCRRSTEVFTELEFCIERKGFFEYGGVDIHEGPKIKINAPYLESSSRIAFDLKKNIQQSKTMKRTNSLSSSKSLRKLPNYMEVDANIESRFTYFVDCDAKKLVKVNGESGAAEPIAITLPKGLGAWGGVCRLPDNSIFMLGGRKYPQDDITEYYVIADNFLETRSMPPLTNVSYHGCVFYSGSIFVFGGIQDQMPVRASVRYNLNEGVWDKLKTLPEPSGFNTCAVVGDCILLSGYHLDKLYAYIPEDDEYIKLCDLPAREYKVVCTAFSKAYVLCAGKLYEAQISKMEQWRIIAEIPKNLATLLSPATKFGQSMHFVLGKNELWRLNLRNNEILRTRIEST